MDFESYQYDFQRLAKEIGFEFHLYREKFKWSDIENVNLQDIIENKNFNHLERSLVNVINYNLDDECDVRGLDKNFLKLFKLAQLGVDYLTFCKLYIHGWMASLEERLCALQEENHLLKKQEKLSSTCKKKRRNLHYKCEACKKVFISEVYLKCHVKRRHNITSSKCEINESKCELRTNKEQSFHPTESRTNRQNQIENDDGKLDDQSTIKSLKRELDDLKRRLIEGEKRKSDEKNGRVSLGSSLQHHVLFSPVLSYAPPDISQRKNEGSNPIELETSRKPYQHHANLNVDNACSMLLSANETALNIQEKNITNKDGYNCAPEKGEVRGNKECMESGSGTNENETIKKFHQQKEKSTVVTQDTLSTPKPFPRRTKKGIGESQEPTQLPRQSSFLEQSPTKNAKLQQSEITQLILRARRSNFLPAASSNETFQNKEREFSAPTLDERNPYNAQPPSIIRQIVTNSPRLSELGKHLKKSLAELYDSVASTGLESGKNYEGSGMRSQRHFWTSQRFPISKEALKQKMREYKQDKRLLSKKCVTTGDKTNERGLLKRLSQTYWNFGNKKNLLKTGGEVEFAGSEIQVNSSSGAHQHCNTTLFKKFSMYTVETESDSDLSLSEATAACIKRPQKYYMDQQSLEACEETPRREICKTTATQFAAREFDFSIFQVRKEHNLQEMKDVKS